jgi:ABC-type antimicrobial peptide transport system permease subunit
MAFNWGDLNPLNWGKDIKQSFMAQLEKGLLYLFYLFVHAMLALFSALLGAGMDAVNDAIRYLVYTISFLGPFSIPVFFAVILILFLGSLDLFKLGKNLPVVGDFL